MDGNKLCMGSGCGSCYIVDLEKLQVIQKLDHRSDVGAVCIMHTYPHTLLTGSDDHIIKAWDLRISKDKKESSGFIGHFGGISSLCYDGNNYVASNAKDQYVKLWDLRKMVSLEKFRKEQGKINFHDDNDYRWAHVYEMKQWDRRRHPCDTSFYTFEGPTVMRTLIRNEFSPGYITSGRYLATGSACGNPHIFDVQRGVLVKRLQPVHSMDRDLCRQVSWHPKFPVLAASSFGRCVHLFNFDSKASGKVENEEESAVETVLAGSFRRRQMRRGSESGEEEEGEERSGAEEEEEEEESEPEDDTKFNFLHAVEMKEEREDEEET